MGNNALKQRLVDKIAGMIMQKSEDSAVSPEPPSDLEKQANLVKTAGEMLKQAAAYTRNLEQENERLAFENKTLSDRLLFEQHRVRAEKLAAKMQVKGLIKSSEFEEKVAELTIMDDTGFDIVKTAVENLHIEKTAATQGFDNLTFLNEALNMNGEDTKPKTFANSIADMG